MKMKKLTLIAVCWFLFSLGDAIAMTDEVGPGFHLGVEAGFNLANLNGPNVNDVVGSRLGFVGGGFLNLPLGPMLAFQPEVLYEQKGGKFGGNSYQLDYVEIPLLLDVSVLGPVGVILGPSFDSNVTSQGVSSVNSEDVGLVMGVQVEAFPILVSGRYEVGLSNVDNNQSIQNGTFTFLLGLSFI